MFCQEPCDACRRPQNIDIIALELIIRCTRKGNRHGHEKNSSAMYIFLGLYLGICFLISGGYYLVSQFGCEKIVRE